jgi:hypothetical protein
MIGMAVGIRRHDREEFSTLHNFMTRSSKYIISDESQNPNIL